MIRTLLVSAALLGAPLLNVAESAHGLQVTTLEEVLTPRQVQLAIASLEEHGLDPADYQAGNYKERWTRAALHLLHGKLDAKSVEPDWTAKRRERDLGAIYERHRAAGTLENSFEELAPSYPEYVALKAELARLQTLTETPRIDRARPTLRPGDSNSAITSVQAQLGVAESGTYDSATADAVKAFQDANDLDADGIIGPATATRPSRPCRRSWVLRKAGPTTRPPPTR